MANRVIGVLAALLLGSCCAHASDGGRGGDLERFGRWVESKRYGEVWVPKVRLGWSPSNNGSYRQNDDGSWVWVSRDPFWSETSTSGRWLKDRGEKWVWKPGLPPAPTGDGLVGDVLPPAGVFGPALPQGAARARQIRYERAVLGLPLVSAPLPLPPLPRRRHGPY